MRIHMVVSMNRGLSPFTRRDVQTLVSEGHEVTLLPTRLGASRDVPPGVKLVDIRTPAGGLALAGGLAAALGSRAAAEPFDRRQPEHIILAGALGLGRFDPHLLAHRVIHA